MPNGKRWLLGLALLAAASPAIAAGAPLKIAITIDDLPVHGPYPTGVTPEQVADQMIAALKAQHVRAFGFINAGRIEEEPSTASVLRRWRAAGLQLGNHGWAHRSLNTLSAADFERELVKNEPTLVETSGGTDWRWFRYPFLDEGKDASQRADARKVLAKHGYRVAAVTTGFSDWQWTQPYARCASAGDAAAIVELEQMYLGAVRESISATRDNVQKLIGRDIPLVLLMHVSAMSARMMPQVLKVYRDAGYRFVSLEEAERDPVYKAYTDLALAAPPYPQELAASKKVELTPETDLSARLDRMCASKS